jgi:hypothetical protein
MSCSHLQARARALPSPWVDPQDVVLRCRQPVDPEEPGETDLVLIAGSPEVEHGLLLDIMNGCRFSTLALQRPPGIRGLAHPVIDRHTDSLHVNKPDVKRFEGPPGGPTATGWRAVTHNDPSVFPLGVHGDIVLQSASGPLHRGRSIP